MTAGIVIIGAGECGGRAALELRARGYQGPITLIGREPHLPYERPPLSKAALTAESAPPPRVIGPFAERGIECLKGTIAHRIDRAKRRVELTDGRSLPYDRLLLATGATPRILPGFPPGKHVAYLRTYEDALRLRDALRPDRVIGILGGGFIGLELAASARARGSSVTVIEAQPRILTRGVPDEIARVIHARHELAGVTMLCGVSIARCKTMDPGVELGLTDGRSLAVDLLIVGVGATPTTDLAIGAGLAIENGIAVDEHLQTSDPAIYAAGDCCSFPLSFYGGRRVRLESWRNAIDQGALAARNMMGAEERISAVPWFWSDQHDLTLQIAGLIDEGATTVRRTLSDDAFILFHLDTHGRLVAASGIGRGNAIAKDIRLAEMLIAKRAYPGTAALADAQVKLKSLLGA